MKRIASIVLISAVISSLLAGCSSGGSAPPSPAASSPAASAAPVIPESPPTDQALSDDYAPSAAADGASTAGSAPAAYDRAGEGELASDYAGESYLAMEENDFRLTSREQTLTFSLKVDTAAYSNVARYIQNGRLPPADAVRTEELINYFSYDDPLRFAPGNPFALYAEVGTSPFDESRRMAFIRVKSRDIDKEALPASNLVFLIDTSGSMDSHDKLPLLKEAFSLLTDTLDTDDRVSIVTYAGSAQVVLDSAPGSDRDAILSAIHTLTAGGSTAGANGIVTAYELAEKNLMPGGNNRVILATDGDFNVGLSSTDELARLIARKGESGVYLSILGFGTGNLRDDVMETLSKHGSGNYAYIDSVATAQKVLVDELGANLFTIADDVKAQVEFNPQNVTSYRLIGYENRALRNEDFEDDTKDAGEIGVGTDVVMMFELELSESLASGPYADELFEVRIRYKNPGESESKLMTQPVYFKDIQPASSSDYRFACSVAAFGHLLRDSEHSGDVTVADVLELAEGSLGADGKGYRRDYLALLDIYQNLL